MNPNSFLLKSLEENFEAKVSLLTEMLFCLQQATVALKDEDSDALLTKLDDLDQLQHKVDINDLNAKELSRKIDNESSFILTFMNEGQNIPIWGQNLYQLHLQHLSLLENIIVLHQKLVTDVSAHSEQLKRKIKGIKKQKELNANYSLQTSLEAGSILNYKEGE